jgi:hypothetical protein
LLWTRPDGEGWPLWWAGGYLYAPCDGPTTLRRACAIAHALGAAVYDDQGRRHEAPPVEEPPAPLPDGPSEPSPAEEDFDEWRRFERASRRRLALGVAAWGAAAWALTVALVGPELPGVLLFVTGFIAILAAALHVPRWAERRGAARIRRRVLVVLLVPIGTLLAWFLWAHLVYAMVVGLDDMPVLIDWLGLARDLPR